ncbi:LysM peptidoglycan-binding domain-containing protein [Pararhodobacter sp.]|uniref:LysM peptidoglycan-binding domain-containing protein n=1 Tax=Pararhodobacter sp. TaxID=2127056 RepID=UPI002B0024B9|nr:LysM peptidoglycan-binding domain-containing protein [Pararhodobacter sp.]
MSQKRVWVLGGATLVVGAAVAMVLATGVRRDDPSGPAPFASLAPEAADPETTTSRATTSEPAQPTTAVPAEVVAVPPSATSEPAPQAAIPPQFDVVRIGRDGSALVAGEAAPGAAVTVRLDGQVVAQTASDGAGQFVMLFSLGHSDVAQMLTLEMEAADGTVMAAEDTVILTPRPAPVAAPVQIAEAEAPGRPAPSAAGPDSPGQDGAERDTTPEELLQPSTVAQAPSVTATATAPERAQITTPAPQTTVPVTSHAELTSPDQDRPAATRAQTESAEGLSTAPVAIARVEASSPEAATPTPTGPVEVAQSSSLARPEPEAASAPATAVAVAAADAEPDAGSIAVDIAPAVAPASGPAMVLPVESAAIERAETIPEILDAPGTSVTAPVVASTPPVTPEVSPVTNLAATESEETRLADAASLPSGFIVRGSGAVEVLDRAPQVMDNVVIDSISYSAAGDVQIAGRAASAQPASNLRIYLDNQPIAVARSERGDWTSDLPHVDPGVYTLRVDQLSDQGRVVSRFETPFQREDPTRVAAAQAQPRDVSAPSTQSSEAAAPDVTARATVAPRAQPDPAAPRAQPDPAPAAAPTLPVSLITVQPGHTLWAISTDRYGAGELYVVIYRANRNQIRDPDLIYPGQVFALPDN